MQSRYRSKIAMREMIKYRYRQGTGLGARSDGIKEPIEPSGHKGRAGIWYQPQTRKTSTDGFGKKVFVPERVSGPSQSSTPEDDIVDGMGRLFMTMIEECCDKVGIKTPTIRNAEPGEGLQYWAASPSLVCRES